MSQQADTLMQLIRSRRIIKPDHMTGQQVPDAQIEQLLQAADWAPTHGRTEPWRFVVHSGEAVKRFCTGHADLYRQHTDEAAFVPGTYDKLLHMGDKASHVVVVYNHRGDKPKIPEMEEVVATACAVQNMLLMAEALGIAAYWGTGGMTYKPSFKQHLGLMETDQVMGILYFGIAEVHPEGKRAVPLFDKVRWER